MRIKEKKIDITKKIIKEKPRSKKEWLEECKKKGIKQATFYNHFKTLNKNNELKYLSDEKKYQLRERNNLAHIAEIRLYVAEIKNTDPQLRNIGLNELMNLCKTQVVTHDSSLLQFFENVFKDDNFSSIHKQLLEVFQYILLNCIKEEQEDLITRLLERNKEAILKFLLSGLPPLQRTAISTLSLRPNRDILNHLYNIIEKNNDENFKALSSVILESLQSHIKQYKVDIKTKLYEIATATSNPEIKGRTINLLGELSGSIEHILA